METDVGARSPRPMRWRWSKGQGGVTPPLQLITDELAELRERGLYRKLRTLSEIHGAHARFKGKDLLLFCGNDYLGLSQDSRVKEAAKQAIDEYGVGAGAARLISGTSDLHERFANSEGDDR